MTPSHDPVDPLDPHEPGDPALRLTEEEEQEVSALLADALGADPVTAPPDVVARLDDVLAGLRAERSTAGTATAAPAATSAAGPLEKAAVVSLHSRRRRLPKVLLAAAAVLVGGFAVGNALDGSLTGGDSGGAGSTDSAGVASDDSGGGASASRPDRRALEGGQAGDNGIVVAPRVRRDHLAGDVRRVVLRFERVGVAGDPAAPRPSAGGDGAADQTRDCPVPRLRETQRHYQVQYQGRPAGLVVGPRRQGQVDVTVYSCRTGGVELSRTVPAP